MSYKHASELEQRLKTEVKQLLELAQKADDKESMELDIPHEIELREKRLAGIRKAKEEIEKRAAIRDATNQAEYEDKLERRRKKEEESGKKPGGKAPKPPEKGPRDKDQYNFTDPDSSIMKSGSTGAFEQDYNAQAAVDQESMLIVGTDLSNNSNDKKELIPVLESIPEEAGKPETIAADTGYFSKDNIDECNEREVEAFISTGRQPHYHSVEELLEKEVSIDNIDLEGLSPTEAMRVKLKTKEGKEVFSRRKSTVEPVFGIIKQAMGFRQFSLRGLGNVKGEWSLVCTAYNLKRLFNLALATNVGL